MTKGNDINELREHLFATLRGVRDKENPMDIDRAKAVVTRLQPMSQAEIEHLLLRWARAEMIADRLTDLVRHVERHYRIGEPR